MSEQRLRLELRPSPLLASALVAAHAAAAACALLALPGVPGALLAAALAALGAASARSRALLRAGASVRALELAGSEATVFLASGDSFRAQVAERRYVSRLMVTLVLRHPVRRTILVARDMLGGDLFRRLRIWALWGRLPAVAAKQLSA